jgi:hypothetical protein
VHRDAGSNFNAEVAEDNAEGAEVPRFAGGSVRLVDFKSAGFRPPINPSSAELRNEIQNLGDLYVILRVLCVKRLLSTRMALPSEQLTTCHFWLDMP